MEPEKRYIREYAEISGSIIPVISAKLTLADRLGGLMVRFDI
jgi:hypothetical protein